MHIHRTIHSFRIARKALDPATRVGFVPTMGALHEGHLSLVREARKFNDIVVASIFVNPTQFGPNEDLDKYPRQLEKDVEVLKQMGVEHVFAPDSMYGPNHLTYVHPEGFDETAEGRSRPGHFQGVATIVTKLFNIVQPTHAYFGQKDAAQCVLIRRIVQDLDMDVSIVVLPTIRKEDGLALSSRNTYLSESERQAAPVLFRALSKAKEFYENSTTPIESEQLQKMVQSTLESEPLVSEVQYVAIDSKETMRPLTRVEKPSGAVVSIACKIGNVRLIDNMIL